MVRGIILHGVVDGYSDVAAEADISAVCHDNVRTC